MGNNGDGTTLTNVTVASGVYSLNPTQAALWADVNLDGWLDLFVANEWTEAKQSYCEFLNNRDGTFANIAKDAGITIAGYFKGVASGDVNNELYIPTSISLIITEQIRCILALPKKLESLSQNS